MQSFTDNTLDQTIPKCGSCSKPIQKHIKFCIECGFPQGGTEEEKAKFHANKVMKQNKHFEADKKVKSARTTLYIVGAATGLLGLVSLFGKQDTPLFITNLILASIYIMLGLWSTKKPLAALLSALLLYITILVFNALVEPSSIFSGIIWKVLILVYLGKGLYSAKAAQKMLEEEKDN